MLLLKYQIIRRQHYKLLKYKIMVALVFQIIQYTSLLLQYVTEIIFK